MTEVLYTIKNGKILDPNIPTDGLVCYLDARGKKNTDVHRGTLLDLSGNGNHGTLSGFDFTESSGYVKDLSGGVEQGLSFDGIDDIMYISKKIILEDFTIYCSLTVDLVDSKELRFQFLPTTDSDYSNFSLQFYRTHITFLLKNRVQDIYEYTSANYGGLGGINNVVIRKKGSSVDLFTATRTVNYTLQQNTLKIQEFQYVQKMLESESLDTLRKIMIYNRALTDEEIIKLMEE